MKTTARTITHFSDRETAELYLRLAETHGHYCPMSTLGLRLGLEAVRHLSGTQWRLRYLARTCAVDGIALALQQAGLSSEVELVQEGQHLLQCRNATDRELTLRLTEYALQLAKQYHSLAESEQWAHLERMRSEPAQQLIELLEGERG